MVRLKTLCADCLNTNCVIKKHVPAKLLTEIDNNKIINRYAKNQFVFHEDSEVNSIYFIHKGIVKIVKNGAFNKDQIVRFSLKGDILGHRGFIDSGLYPVSAQTVSDSEICYLPKKHFFELLYQVPQLTIHLMLIYSNELSHEEAKLRDMALFNVREKVAKALLMAVERFGLNSNQEIKNIDLLTRQDLAESVGLTSNQVTKILGEFKLDNIIETEGKKIKLLKQNSLEKMVDY